MNPQHAQATTQASEQRRLQELHSLQLLGTPDEPRFDRYTKLLQQVLDTPVAVLESPIGDP